MASPRSEEPRARLFVALDLPADARADLRGWRGSAFAGRADLRLVSAEALHVTLVFLGSRPEREVGRIQQLVTEAVAGRAAPVLCAAGVRAVPPRRPRLFALDLEDRGGAAGELQAAVASLLAAEGVYKPEKRPFWPHVTLARVKARVGRVAPLEAAPPPDGVWRGEAVTLYRSLLRPQGAVYEALGRTPLG